EAPLAHVDRLERVPRPALLAPELLCRHMEKPPPGLWRRFFRGETPTTSPRPLLEPDGIGTVPAEAGGCRGFTGPVPPPLWMRPAMCREVYPGRRRLQAPV